MFKEYFTRLFTYDKHVNQQFAALILSAGDNERAVELMSHLLNAQQIWLSRCLGTSTTNYQLWPKFELQSFNDIIERNYSEWVSFINTVVEPSQSVTYQNFKGDKFSNKLLDILAHVINHGTHHRAQIGMLLKQSEGIELPSTDYVHYVRGLQ